MSNATRFLEDLSEQAYLSAEDARELTVDFLEVLPGFIDRETWDLISDMVPVEVTVNWEQVPEPEDRSIEAFLHAMSREEKVASPRAAEHARAVAETIRSHSDPEQMQKLRSTMRNENILALFESVRGELTAPEKRDGPPRSS